MGFSSRKRRRLVRAGAAVCLLGVFGFRAEAGGFVLGWRPPQVVLRWPGSAGDGYAAAAYLGSAYVADVSTLRAGSRTFSEIRFSTNRSGAWVRTIVAKIEDDPDTGGQTLPRIAVVPDSGHVVIVVGHPKADGASELLAFTNASGAWTPAPLPPGQGVDDYVNPSAPSLAADGSEAVLAFNASSRDQDCAAQEGDVYLSRLSDGARAWSSVKNVTSDYCGPKGGFAKDPVVAASDGGTFLAYQCAGDPNGSPGAMCLRSGDLGAASEDVVETNTPDWGMGPGLYALSVDGGAPRLAYIMNQNNQLRLMLARKGPDGWRRTPLATGGSPKTGEVLSLPPSLAAASGSEVAYVGYAKWPLGGNDSRAVFLLRDQPSGRPSPPRDFTGSKFSDAFPVLASSKGLLHLFFERDGQSVLWTREEPIPVVTVAVAPRGAGFALSGTIAPASGPEKAQVCLEQSQKPGRWTPRGCEWVNTRLAAGQASFSTSWPKLVPGSYRARAAAVLTDAHLARTGAWEAFAVAAPR